MYKLNYLLHFITVVIVCHFAVLSIFGLMVFVAGLDQAIDNIGGWYETQADGEVYYHAYNYLHFMAISYLPAMVLALPLTLVDRLNKRPQS
mgnify:FL=1|jgi:Na+-driven multidrug efflux pump|tara:strand:+ start:157 stop:429 length:273 start_codon:yes stop_codon:yes gene_type:complete